MNIPIFLMKKWSSEKLRSRSKAPQPEVNLDLCDLKDYELSTAC